MYRIYLIHVSGGYKAVCLSGLRVTQLILKKLSLVYLFPYGRSLLLGTRGKKVGNRN